MRHPMIDRFSPRNTPCEMATSAVSIEESYSYCRSVAKTRAKNFYYSFLLLSREQRNAMCAVYAFMRRCDDLSDEPGASYAALKEWRRSFALALANANPPHPIMPALLDAIIRYQIPHQYFYEMIDGVISDLFPRRFDTFDELYKYCYKVASVVGLTIIHIFGFESPQALNLAEKSGIAFQLTNILRDIREDADRGRQYLPTEDLMHFGVSEDDIKGGSHTRCFIELMRFEVDRARQYYEESAPLLGLVHPRSRPSLWAMITIYSRLLDRIRDSSYDVLSQRISLSSLEKSWILLRAIGQREAPLR